MLQYCPSSFFISCARWSWMVSPNSLISAILRTISLIPAPRNKTFRSIVFCTFLSWTAPSSSTIITPNCSETHKRSGFFHLNRSSSLRPTDSLILHKFPYSLSNPTYHSLLKSNPNSSLINLFSATSIVVSFAPFCRFFCPYAIPDNFLARQLVTN